MVDLRTIKLITATLETILSVPILGGMIVIMFLWTPLAVMLGLHIAGYITSKDEKKETKGHVVGIIGSSIGWIPFIGWGMHLATAIILWDEYKEKK